MSYNGGTTAINPTTYGSRSSGYESYGAVMGNQVGQGGQYTDSGASNRGVNFDDKWNRWFGVPPYSNFQHDNYAGTSFTAVVISWFCFLLWRHLTSFFDSTH